MKAKTLHSHPTWMLGRPHVGDGLPADGCALALHDCIHSYHELQKSIRWWNLYKKDPAIRAYNQALQRFEAAVAREHSSDAAHAGLDKTATMHSAA